jgi:RNA-directed DNA polymerase
MSKEIKLSVQSNSWVRIGLLAKRKGAVINNLFCHINVENLREAYQAIDGSKATGMDRVTKREYGNNLDINLESLVSCLHKGTYRPQERRGVSIPKADGKTRLIAVASFEDKLVEWVVSQILTQLYEPMFIETSYGFRPKRNTLQAVKTVFLSLFKKDRSYVVDIDLKSFFDTVSHRKLIKILEKRIADRKLLSLISRFLTGGIMVEGELQTRSAGTPQGGVVSPILANIYLHYVLDTWFLENFAKTGGVISRYADDVVFTFKSEQEARRFQAQAQERLERYDLQINEDKSGMIEFKPKSGNVFHFTGFTFYWGKDRGSQVRRLKIKTQKKRMYKALSEYEKWLKVNRNKLKLSEIWAATAAKLRGHYNYFGVYCNRPKLNQFYYAVVGYLFKWLNRRSQKRSYKWDGFAARLRQNPLPQPPPVAALKKLIDRVTYAY